MYRIEHFDVSKYRISIYRFEHFGILKYRILVYRIEHFDISYRRFRYVGNIEFWYIVSSFSIDGNIDIVSNVSIYRNIEHFDISNFDTSYLDRYIECQTSICRVSNFDISRISHRTFRYISLYRCIVLNAFSPPSTDIPFFLFIDTVLNGMFPTYQKSKSYGYYF